MRKEKKRMKFTPTHNPSMICGSQSTHPACAGVQSTPYPLRSHSKPEHSCHRIQQAISHTLPTSDYRLPQCHHNLETKSSQSCEYSRRRSPTLVPLNSSPAEGSYRYADFLPLLHLSYCLESICSLLEFSGSGNLHSGKPIFLYQVT